MTLEDKARLIANRHGMPYAWQDLMERLEKNIKLPMKINCEYPINDIDDCSHEAKWIIHGKVDTSVGVQSYARILCTRHKNIVMKENQPIGVITTNTITIK